MVNRFDGGEAQAIVAEAALEPERLHCSLTGLAEHEAHADRAACVADGFIEPERLRSATGDSGAGNALGGVFAGTESAGLSGLGTQIG